MAKHKLEFQSFTVLSIKTIPDFELQTKPTERNDCDNEEKFQILLDNFPERFYFGITKLRLTLENKQNFMLCESQKSCDVLKLFGKISYTEIKEGDRESNLQKNRKKIYITISHVL